MSEGIPLGRELLRLIGRGGLQRYDVLKRYGASAHDAVHEAIESLLVSGALVEEGVLLKATRYV